MKKWFLLSTLLFADFLIAAELPHPQFRHLTAVDGLSGGEVTCFLQDRNGFVWIGTEGGLNKYDGCDITVYRHSADANSVAGNSVRCLFEDSRNNLWIGTRGDGLSKLDLSTGRFSNYQFMPGDSCSLSYNDVAGIVEDSGGNLWIAADRGSLDRFDPLSGRFERFALYDSSSQGRMLSNAITDIVIDPQERIWLSSWGGGIYMFDRDDGSFRDILNELGLPESRFCRHIFDLYLDGDGWLWWASAHGGLYRLNVSSPQVDFAATESVGSTSLMFTKSVAVDRRGDIWVLTPGEVVVLDGRSMAAKHVFSDEDRGEGLLSNASSHIYTDSDGTVWIGHPTGVSYCNPLFSRFSFTPVGVSGGGSADRCVMSILKDSRGDVWVGQTNWLCRYGPDGRAVARYLPPNLAETDKNRYNQALCEDSQGDIWIGSYSNVLLRYSRRSDRFERIVIESSDSTKIPFGNVREIYEDRDGSLWIATEKGTVNYDPRSGVFTPLFQSERIIYPEDKSRTVLRDRAGELWVGTEGGLRRYDPDGHLVAIYSTRSEHGPLENYITSLLEDRDGCFWVGTRGGLYLMDRASGGFTLATPAGGEYYDSITGIGEDSEGNMWLCTQSQVVKWNRARNTYSVYDESDGLRGNGLQNIFCCAGDGEMFIGNADGFSRFRPEDLRAEVSSNRVLLTDLQIFNRSVVPQEGGILHRVIGETEHITVKHNQSMLTFKFSAVNILEPDKIKYRYKLDGFSDGWTVLPKGQRQVTYINLDAGDYVLHVSATDNNGLWNAEDTQIGIKVLPPFWRTAFAYVLYLLTTLALTYGIIRWFISRERDRQSVREAKLEAQKARELETMRTELFTNVSHEFRTPLTLILGPLEQIMASRDESAGDAGLYTLMYRNVRRLQRLINQILDFRKLEDGRMEIAMSYGNVIKFVEDLSSTFGFMAREKNIEFEVVSDDNASDVYFDPDKTDKILYNLLSNAFKYTPAGGKIEVRTHRYSEDGQEYLDIEVNDTGIGMSEQSKHRIFDVFYRDENSTKFQTDGFGVGLALVKSLVDMLGGSISVDTGPDCGSRFRVTLPLTGYDTGEAVVSRVPDVLDRFASEPAVVGSAATADNGGATLLVVEDNSDLRAYIRTILADSFRIMEAVNGREGYDMAVEQIPDIIISDVLMPVADGLELVAMLRANDKTNHIPVVLLTACSAEDQVVSGLGSGADDYITKPFSTEILKARLRNILDNRRKLWELYRKSDSIEAFRCKLPNPQQQTFVDNLHKIILERLSDTTLGVESLASQMNMTADQLLRKTKALTDTTPYGIILRVRMQQAMELMRSGNMNITEVAFAVGYQEVSHFSRAFKKQYGKSPRQYMADVGK